MTEQNGLERSSATDELRRLLDERGVEWTEPNNEARSHTTYWTAGALRCMAVEFTDCVVSIASSSHDLTPEQAIEATLGSGTCRMVPTRDKPRSKVPTLTCSECGWWTDKFADRINYCPNCGRAVRA